MTYRPPLGESGLLKQSLCHRFASANLTQVGHVDPIHLNVEWVLHNFRVTPLQLNQKLWLKGNVNTTYLVPKSIPLLSPQRTLSTTNEQPAAVREDKTIWRQPFFSSKNQRCKLVLDEEAMANPLCQDDVHLLDALREFHLLHLAPDDCDNIVKLVVSDELLGNLGNGAALNGNHSSSLCVGRKHGQKPTATSYLWKQQGKIRCSLKRPKSYPLLLDKRVALYSFDGSKMVKYTRFTDSLQEANMFNFNATRLIPQAPPCHGKDGCCQGLPEDHDTMNKTWYHHSDHWKFPADTNLCVYLTCCQICILESSLSASSWTA